MTSTTELTCELETVAAVLQAAGRHHQQSRGSTPRDGAGRCDRARPPDYHRGGQAARRPLDQHDQTVGEPGAAGGPPAGEPRAGDAAVRGAASPGRRIEPAARL